MSESNKEYELNVLGMAISQYLNENTSLTESSLNSLIAEPDQVVWEIATKIYSQSGYRVDLSQVRNIVDSRIIVIKNHLAEEALHNAKQKAEYDAKKARRADERKVREAEEERRLAQQKNQQEAEEAHRLIEQKAQQKAEEARQLAEKKAQQKAEEARQLAEKKAQQEHEELRRAAESDSQFFAKRKSEIFMRVRKVICEQLSMDEAKVTFNSHLSSDLSADPLALMEILMALEEEFDMDIGEEYFLNRLDSAYPDRSCTWFPIFSSSPSLPSPPRYEGKIGEKALVSNVVEMIWENAPEFWKKDPA